MTPESVIFAVDKWENLRAIRFRRSRATKSDAMRFGS